jgi:hypothetical protein
MSYDPRNRYRSYDEMIIALEGAIKALENGGGHQAAAAHAHAHAIQRMQLRHKQKKTLIITTVSIVVGLIVAFVFIRLLTSDDSGKTTVIDAGHTEVNNADNSKEIISQYNGAKSLMNQGKYRESEDAFIKLFSNPKVEEPTRSWAGLDGVISALLDGRTGDTIRHAKSVSDHIDKHAATLPPSFSAVLSPALKSLERQEFQDIKKLNFTKADDEHMMSCMIYALKNWEQGGIDKAVPFFEKITSGIQSNNNGPMGWYRKIADNYLSDYKLLKSSAMNSTPSTQNQCKVAIEELNGISNQIKTRGRAKYNVRSRQSDLDQHGKYLEKLVSGE